MPLTETVDSDRGRTTMTTASRNEDHHQGAPLATGEEFALRLFTIVMAGLCAVILLMILAGEY